MFTARRKQSDVTGRKHGEEFLKLWPNWQKRRKIIDFVFPARNKFPC